MSLLRRYRQEMDLTQEELAKKMGISVQAYRNYEKGIRPMPYKVMTSFLKVRDTKEDRKILKELEEWN